MKNIYLFVRSVKIFSFNLQTESKTDCFDNLKPFFL